MNLLVKVAISLVVDVEGAELSDGDGLGRCVFLMIIKGFATSGTGKSPLVVSLGEAVTPRRLSAAGISIMAVGKSVSEPRIANAVHYETHLVACPLYQYHYRYSSRRVHPLNLTLHSESYYS